MARIPFARHRTVNQIRQTYRACRHPIEKVRWHALWLLARTDEPRTPAQVAAVVGLPGVTARAVLPGGEADLAAVVIEGADAQGNGQERGGALVPILPEGDRYCHESPSILQLAVAS